MPAKKSDASDAKEVKEAKETKEPLSIEESLARIEAIIQTLESPDTGLQDAMKLYTEGVGLLDDCQKTLEGVEQQLKVLSPEEV